MYKIKKKVYYLIYVQELQTRVKHLVVLLHYDNYIQKRMKTQV